MGTPTKPQGHLGNCLSSSLTELRVLSLLHRQACSLTYSVTHAVTYSVTQQTFPEHLLCTRTTLGVDFSKCTRHDPCSLGVTSQ